MNKLKKANNITV